MVCDLVCIRIPICLRSLALREVGMKQLARSYLLTCAMKPQESSWLVSMPPLSQSQVPGCMPYHLLIWARSLGWLRGCDSTVLYASPIRTFEEQG